MGSYLSQVLNHKITALQGLAKSVGYLKQKLGLAATDDQVDKVVTAAEAGAADAATVVQGAFAAYIKAHAPFLPADVIATIATTAGLQMIDAAIAGAGNVVKANN